MAYRGILSSRRGLASYRQPLAQTTSGSFEGENLKLLVASDLHGSATYVKKLFERIEEEKPDRDVLLGDLLYHGPRNDLPDGYSPREVAATLNAAAELITAVRGNCDAEVDQMVLDFPCMADYALMVVEGTPLLFTHGHVLNPASLKAGRIGDVPVAKGTFLFSGHTHVKGIDERDGIVFVNPGSVSMPKDECRSFCVVDEETVTLNELESGRVICAHSR